jgi:hypothetical protein
MGAAPPCIKADPPYSLLTEGMVVTPPTTKAEINFCGRCAPGLLVYSEKK